ncbi:SDR family NAD(P)-dependent oxidoreductase, partial [Burkholderia pseudomallei]
MAARARRRGAALGHPAMAGKRAFITGAAGGLGRAIARRMAEQGAQVFLTDIVDAA